MPLFVLHVCVPGGRLWRFVPAFSLPSLPSTPRLPPESFACTLTSPSISCKGRACSDIVISTQRPGITRQDYVRISNEALDYAHSRVTSSSRGARNFLHRQRVRLEPKALRDEEQHLSPCETAGQWCCEIKPTERATQIERQKE